MDERAELAREKRRKKFKNDRKKKKPAHERASVTPASSPRDAVLALLSAMRSPAHVAALSVAYKQKTGRAMKQDHKRGGMLAFLKTELKEEVIVVGTGNDSFVSLATPTAKAVHWLRECVRDNGPVLISMIGRLYHEAHGIHFGEAFPQASLTNFLQARLGKELTFETQKGQEQLVELLARDAPRYFLPQTSKKQRQPADGADAAPAAPAASPSLDPSSLLGRGGSAAYPPSARLLVVGEADFSWSEALLGAWRLASGGGGKAAGKTSAASLTATSYDDAAALAAKYPGVEARCKALKAAGACIVHGVDATALGGATDGAAASLPGPYDLVAFHFPHVGGDDGLAASLAANTALLARFLAAVPAVLVPGGEVHVTLVHRYPYTAWRKAWAGGIAGLDYLGCAPFDFGAFPGYRHQATTATAGLRGDTHAAALEVNTRCMTYAWRKAKDAPAAAAPAAPAAKKGKAARSPRVAAAPAAAEEDPLLAEANAALRRIQAEPAAPPAAKKRKGAVAGAAPAASEAAPKKKKKKKAQPGPE